jgi:radical SAM superfamily enzyme YgiQ (UPF0313 family)
MPDIILTSLNAKYIHPSLGLRYLLANLRELKPRAGILEFDINQRPMDMAESLLSTRPRIIGFGVYIWNVAPTTEVVAILKKVAPEVIVVLGGPEVSYEVEVQPIIALADYVVTGEADLAFAELCGHFLSGERPSEKLIAGGFPEFQQLSPPYDLYTGQDLEHRITYVEASRGCPFGCEFCLSSLDIPLRRVPLDQVLGALQRLLDRGATHFKFVDRTFNIDLVSGRAILEFLLERYRPGLFFHFEIVPDRLPDELRSVVARFPAGALQLEAGIQTFNPAVAARIQRRQDESRLEENLRFLRSDTGVHLHTDLIFGLPGETLESFAAGFDRLIRLNPQEIQVGLLKRLRGAPIARHDGEWAMVYSPHPPYEILRNRDVDFTTVQRMRRFARYWDLVGNSGNFAESRELLWSSSALPGWDEPRPVSSFHRFMRLSDWLHQRLGRSDSIALTRLIEAMFEFLTVELCLEAQVVAAALWRDYERGGRRDAPGFLRPHLPDRVRAEISHRTSIPKRQARHLAAPETGTRA